MSVYYFATTDVLQFKRVPHSSLLHSHQKPIDLLEFLILKSSNENEIVLDSFEGVGSTAIACINSGRNWIGIELEKEYVEMANKRIEEHLESKTE